MEYTPIEIGLIAIFVISSVIGWLLWSSEVRKDPTINPFMVDLSKLGNSSSRWTAAVLYVVAIICAIILIVIWATRSNT